MPGFYFGGSFIAQSEPYRDYEHVATLVSSGSLMVCGLLDNLPSWPCSSSTFKNTIIIHGSNSLPFLRIHQQLI